MYNLIEMRISRKQKNEERDNLKTQGRTLVNREGEMTEEESTSFDQIVERVKVLDSEIAGLDARISKLESLEGDAPVEASVDASRSQVRKPFFPAINTGKVHQYDAAKALRGYFTGKLDGLEAEWDQEIGRNQKRQRGGFFLPYSTRATGDFTTTNAAGSIVEHVDGSVIEYLRNNAAVLKLGATVLDGLAPGKYSFPRQTGTGAAAFVSEGNATSATTATVDEVVLDNNTITAYTNITRKTMFQSNIPSIGNFIAKDLKDSMAVTLDAKFIYGSGTGEPLGFDTDSNVPTVAIGTNGGAPTFAKIVELKTTVAKNNGLRGKLAFLTSAEEVGKLETTEKASGYPDYLAKDNKLHGYDLHSSQNVSVTLTKGSGTNLTALYFGNWEDYMVGIWGQGAEVVEDDISLATSGGKRIIVLMDVDGRPRLSKSFVKCKDLSY